MLNPEIALGGSTTKVCQCQCRALSTGGYNLPNLCSYIGYALLLGRPRKGAPLLIARGGAPNAAMLVSPKRPASTAQVDVWALGISAVEMAEVAPPRWAVHPMRVIFMISRDPPPQLADRDRWSLPFHDFVAQCLQKVNPCARTRV